MPQYLCRRGVPTGIHAGAEIKLGCSNGDISAMPWRHSELFMFNGLKLWQKARSLPVQTQLTKQPVIHCIFYPGNKALWIQECFLKSSPTCPIIPQIFSHNLRPEKVVPYRPHLVQAIRYEGVTSNFHWEPVFQSLGILCFTPLPRLWKSIGITIQGGWNIK
jgi:hypothetical protein